MLNYSTNDRPHMDLVTELSQNDTPLTKVPMPKTFESPQGNYQEVLASDRYKDIIEQYRKYNTVTPVLNGIQNFIPLIQQMMNSHFAILHLEYNFRQQLEALAIDVVFNEFGINREDLNVIAKILDSSEIDSSKHNRDDEDEENPSEVQIPSVEINIEMNFDQNVLLLERAKRRLINAIIQGVAVRGHWMYHLCEEEIVRITGSSELIEHYGIMMSLNDLNYWQLANEHMNNLSGSMAGQSEVERPEEEEEDNTTIRTVGVNFPVLIHEIIKGIFETIAIHGQPTDIDLQMKVAELEDTLDKEIWDIRLGPAIWKQILFAFPDRLHENKSLQLQVFMDLFKLPAKKFLVFMQEIMSGNGLELFSDFVFVTENRLIGEEYEDSMETFNKNLSKTDDNIDDLLKNLNIKPSKDDDDFLNEFR